MKLSPGALLEHARSEEGRKQLRYAGISVVFVPVGQIMLQLLAHFVFHAGKDDSGAFTKASLLTAAILTGPNFLANRAWVWRDSTKDRLRMQILVFWVAAMLGVALSTLLTLWVEHLVRNLEQDSLTVIAAVFLAQLTGFGIVWVGRYLLLDRWLFKVTHHGEEPPAELLDDLHREFPI
ncbi:MAG: GtrA family protein [Acidimicrobiales bacterium]